MGSDPQLHAELSGRGKSETLPESGTGGADFKLLADALPHIVWVCRPEGALEFLNRQGIEFFGVAPASCPFPSGSAVHPEDAPHMLAAWDAAMRVGEPLKIELRLQRFDGHYRWHATHVHPVRDDSGKTVKWMGTSTDVHDIKEANECSAFLLALATELAPMGDPQELVCAAMTKLRERLGAALVTLVELDEVQSEAVMLRQRDSDGSQIEVASLPLRPFENLMVGARQGLVTVMHDVRADMRAPFLYDRWFGMANVGAVVSAPLLQGGQLVALLSVVEAAPRQWSDSEIKLVRRVGDIVWPSFEKARADRAVEEALKEVNQRKDEFLAMLGHELRNPLAPIRSAVQILRVHGSGNSELEWARAVIDRQTRHLSRLVDDLLDVSRIVRGQIVLQREEIDLAEIVRHGVETSRPLIRSRGHRLHVQLPQRPVWLPGDLTRLAQVLSNLLNNAAKYTDEGGDIWLEAQFEGQEAVLRVRDTGAGIAPSLLPRVFELFAQAERTLDRSQGGLGIGLTLVKLLVEMHGGTVEAKSPGLGAGAEFVVRLPASEAVRAHTDDNSTEAQAADNGAEAHTAESTETWPVEVGNRQDNAMRILVVDDNVDAADSTALLLSLDGYETQSVHSAKAALEAAVSMKPDVVLLDIGLPEMDGYDVAKRLRAQTQGSVPTIVALTGYGQPADRDRAARAGFDEFLVKPVEPAVLNGLLKSLREPGRKGTPVAPFNRG